MSVTSLITTSVSFSKITVLLISVGGGGLQGGGAKCIAAVAACFLSKEEQSTILCLTPELECSVSLDVSPVYTETLLSLLFLELLMELCCLLSYPTL